MFRGNSPARIDDKGRLKIPQGFRSALESKYGRELFLTSLTGEYLRIYPLPVWLEIERKLGDMPFTDPGRAKYLARVNYYGDQAEIDAQGRVLIPFRLRDSATMSGEVDVLGQYNYLDVWNHERFLLKLQSEPLTDAELRSMGESRG